jgi:site-specific recombinase XerD
MPRASTHWLRLTNASHALNRRLGHAPVPQKYVQNILGHSSFVTTSGYLRTERDKLQAMERLG